jgi:hypothetical protein
LPGRPYPWFKSSATACPRARQSGTSTWWRWRQFRALDADRAVGGYRVLEELLQRIRVPLGEIGERPADAAFAVAVGNLSGLGVLCVRLPDQRVDRRDEPADRRGGFFYVGLADLGAAFFAQGREARSSRSRVASSGTS